MATLDDLERWLKARSEDEHLELKEAKHGFDRDKLARYCAALANERGGRLVLGVSDRRPRAVVGTQAFEGMADIAHELLQRLHLRVDVQELLHPDGRVLVFTVPSRSIATPIGVDGTYLMRAGASLVAMTPDQLRRIFDEAEPDPSAAIAAGATVSDLASDATARFRRLWERRQPSRRKRTDVQILEDAELLRQGAVTVAALVLLGTPRALGRHLAQSEIIFEYRNDEAAIRSDHRVELRDAFLRVDDELWRLVNLRNTVHQYVERMVRTDIPAISEVAFREAVLNAVCHRDYRRQGSIFVKQWPTRVVITSPGGFPEGVTAETIVFDQAPRNRRLAEAFGRCGLVERAGEGADMMFEIAVREGKLPPDFSGSDEHRVQVTMHARVEDEGFMRFIERAERKLGRELPLSELLVLDAVRRGRSVPKAVTGTVRTLAAAGLLERAGQARWALARAYYRRDLASIPSQGANALDLSDSKARLVRHVAAQPGTSLASLVEVLPGLSRSQVQALLRELRAEGRIVHRGHTRAARWYPCEGEPT